MCIVHSELRTIIFLHLTAASSYCANGWTETNFKKCLKFVNTPIKSWDDAQAACRSFGANLLTLNTPDEVEYIKIMRTLLPGERQHPLLYLLTYYHQWGSSGVAVFSWRLKNWVFNSTVKSAEFGKSQRWRKKKWILKVLGCEDNNRSEDKVKHEKLSTIVKTVKLTYGSDKEQCFALYTW